MNSELEDLRQGQRLYRELFEESLGLMCVHDLDGVLLVVNPAAAQSLGFRPQDGVGVNMKAFLAPPVQHLFDDYLDRIRRNRSDAGLMRLVARDGSERIWLYRNVLYEEPGSPPRVLGHAQDITQRVRAEEALKDSERRFRSMADTAPVFIWVTGTTGQCEFVNKAWLDFSGRPFEDELGSGWMEGLDPEDRERCLADFAQASTNRAKFQGEYRMRRADGEYQWILTAGTPRFNSAGQFEGHIGSCVDVTEARRDREALRAARDELARRVAERTAELVLTNEALRQSQQHYEVLTNLAPVGIFRTDAQGRFLYFNERICEICGFSPEEVRQGFWDRILEPEEQSRVSTEWFKVVGGSGPGSLEHRIRRRDGTTVWALTHFAAERGPRGEVVGCIGTVADISARKHAEEENRKLEIQVQHAQRLQSLGILAGGLAHDFNNLLTIIMGHARIARLELPPESQALENLAEIETATSRAAELTSQMLAYSGKGRFTLQAVNLSRAAEETAKLLHTMIPKKTATQFNLPHDLPAIQADPAQIRQIVMNLITNAAEAIGEAGGSIQVSTGVMDVDRTYLSGTYFDDHLPAGRYVFLEVSDTGCGMSPETQAKIFDPFFTTKFTGRGLGLAAVIGIVRAHHGALSVSSQPGRGSTFRLLFPGTGKMEETHTESPLMTHLARGSGTILVVDDESGMRNLARTILENSGYTVLTAYDGGDAIRVFRRHAGEVAAIVLDLTMPVMNGEETAAELQRIRAGVPIILSSGYSEQEAAGSFGGLGLAGFLKKPYVPSELTRAVQKAIERPLIG
ncbi:MAG TPA: PAS domain S-box protein [Bryobacteraceae bacterium]|jgi:PAS domain S-box-containing protein|nr:PAS domain S-box protein [Bryobacteraceae bacterium]